MSVLHAKCRLTYQAKPGVFRTLPSEKFGGMSWPALAIEILSRVLVRPLTTNLTGVSSGAGTTAVTGATATRNVRMPMHAAVGPRLPSRAVQQIQLILSMDELGIEKKLRGLI